MSGFHSIGSGYSANSAFAMNTTMTNSSRGFLQAANGNSTFQVINEFKFLAARSIRQSAIILSVFNTISAFAAALGILYDCYQRAQRNRTRGQAKPSIFTCVKGAETYPFILSLAITIQGIIFAVSQSRGLDGLFAKGCSLISQFMWPAIFIVPYVQLIFGIEIALRGLRTKPFPPRGKWTVAICMAVWKMLLVITGLVAFFIPSSDFCFASLFWFVAKWAEGGFALFMTISVILIACAVIVFLKLTRHATIETSERVQASRMVYYLAVGILSNILMVPFFIYLTFNNLGDMDGDAGLTLSMIATVVANVSGLMNGGLHLFFRSNIISTIGPRDKMAEYERQQLKHKIRKADSNDYDFSSHVLQPVSGPRQLGRTASEESLVRYEKEEESVENQSLRTYGFSPNPSKSNSVFPSTTIPRAPEPAQLPASTLPSAGIHQRRPSTSYSLFPSNAANTTSVAMLPATTYSPVANTNPFDFETLKPPPSIKTGGRHRRDSSMASSATVQIGLRFSNVDDMPPMASTMVKNAEQVHNLDCPKALRPSPLAAFTGNEPSSPSEPQSPVSATSSRDPVKDARMKTLPPVPRAVTLAQVDTSQGQEGLLSSKVYRPESPVKKIPSPKGVGFNVPKRANTTPVQETATSPPPPRNRGNSDVAERRGDWI
ncbi:uncharacterized protein JN550_006760 [Neoarthrinium moseri]|uniref:uncharacterized protein n=1 Tax=Neoarthrinium moseri TaxID=1658444 RepID=UPI001FDBA6B1|nr:uncharacterized protein JN550_006760 [Neoarthrinium moseri]KAI1867953.1 hypothetical protein JN550_006760 [Neoarthrinium moseri]